MEISWQLIRDLLRDQQVLKELLELEQSETTTGASTCIIKQLNFKANIGFDNITAALVELSTVLVRL